VKQIYGSEGESKDEICKKELQNRRLSALIIIIIIIIIIILYYLCAESTATRPITDTAQCRYTNNKCNNAIIQ
jgi:hypothetical protein